MVRVKFMEEASKLTLRFILLNSSSTYRPTFQGHYFLNLIFTTPVFGGHLDIQSVFVPHNLTRFAHPEPVDWGLV